MTRRLRYAPSPTGKLHIGGARTALLNYLIAKNTGGKFIIRIEDTDISRNINDGELNQIKNLAWLGIKADEDPIKGGKFGPYRQTERLNIYNKYVDELLEKGIAYKCWCTPEELNKEREKEIAKGNPSPKYSGRCYGRKEGVKGVKPSIRIKVPTEGEVKWDDGVRGIISFPKKDIGDWVIRKSNGIPTYNFAVVIDDHLMEITDVLRGEEHISNTPKQILLYEALGWDIPKFFHLSIIQGEDRKKLSKRDEKTLQFIHLYKERGYLPEAIFNFLSLLGWSPEGEKEIFSKEELIKIFDENRLSKAPSFFDIKKLLWTNNQYIKELNEKDLQKFLNPFVKNFRYLSQEQKNLIFKTFQPQLKEGIEIIELTELFVEEYSVENELKEFVEENINTIKDFLKRIKKIKKWEVNQIKSAMLKTGSSLNVKGRNLMMPIRIATTGKKSGPDIASVLRVFGKEKTILRLEKFINED
ncbi:MAG: glutamate--tRNA ligase [Candidatus Tyloplasma litorale]|nr:MAG: glutamate--tRNA ligase [Mycoplasmatales bacterium]